MTWGLNPYCFVPMWNVLTDSFCFNHTGMILQVAVVQSLCMWKWGAKWMLPMTIGAYSKSCVFTLDSIAW